MDKLRNALCCTYAAIGVEDALKKDRSVAKLILTARRVVKILRTQTFMYMLQKQNLKKPIIDCTTRWGSTHDMLIRLLELKDFCTEMSFTNLKKFKNLTNLQWNKIVEITNALEPARKCTRKLQYEQMPLSTFWKYWKECKITTEQVGSGFAKLIVKNMTHRETILIDSNDVVLTAIFLDPRFKVILDSDKTEKAKMHLKKVWARILALKANENDADSSASEGAETRSTNSSDDLELFLKYKEREKKAERSIRLSQEAGPSNSFTCNAKLMLSKRIDNILNSYDLEQKRIDRSMNILEFWEKNKEAWPELYALSQVVLTVPATQVTVERLFSGLKFLLSPLRSKAKKKILEDQILVRTNRIFEKKEGPKL
ncbi:hypothetical protein NQ314_021376 [Rhamnusium bicolor]|uniref:HAT C-terminal dimerisation domain-containing protein n=1 Tax=Rhamnusium bicolor TaxID=1586634 RepID=A0AAV8WJ69_9CUCU|nr:hypothetical protein NQ314_021376 [Rhamnusium bicolor]